MKTRDIAVGLVILVILIGGVLIIKKSLSVPQTLTTQEKIEKTFNGLKIPNDAERIDLTDVSGGESFGIATNTEILANLPDLSSGQVYQAWLLNDQGKKILLGSLKNAKGGYIIEYNSSKYPTYTKIVVSLGSKNILEGSF